MIRFEKIKGKYSKDKSIYINMEKFSSEWKKFYMEKLSEKFKYLFISEMDKNYEILNLFVTDISTYEDNIESISVDLELDYHGPCDGISNDIGHMLNKISSDVHNFFYTHLVDPITLKFTKGNLENVIVNDPFILDFHFKIDELHKVIFYININYNVK